jgi:hypothetical protein
MVMATDDYIYENEDGGKGEYIWDITHLDEGTSYYISGVIDDGVNDEGFDCSEHRLIRDHIFPPNDFSVANGDMISEPLNVWNTHNTRPQLSWNMFTTNYIFFITVWEGNDNNGTKIFEAFNVTEFNIDIDPETGRLEYGKTYFAEIFAQSYTGGISGTATITINIINTKPAPPTVNFSPQKPTSTNALICLEPPEKLDDDGDIITYSYRWYKDDDPQEEFNDIRTIPPEKLVKGDEWTVEVIPNDGIENGLSTMSYITIWNTLPEISIENPSKSDEYYSNTKINVYGTAVDADGDTITVEWYLDIDDPNNVSKLALGTEDPIMSGGEEALSFESKFSKGKHNLTLFVRDGDVGKDFSLGVVKTISFDVVGPDPSADGGKDGEDVTTSVAIGSILAIIIVVVILILFLQMRKRKPKSEREQLYGKDQGLKPGEAYPVEDDESYFGDELDRKGVSSFDSPPPAPPQTPAPTKKEEVTGAEKPPQLPPPESKKE